MSKSQYKKQLFGCPNCSQVQEHYVWSDTQGSTGHVCTKGGCGTVLMTKDIIQPKKKKVPGIRTDTKNRV